MTEPSAKVITDSITDYGHRLTTMEVTHHRFVLAEENTHRVFSRNSASSRAIPVEKQLERFMHDAAYPVEWPSEQPGMSGGEGLGAGDHEDALRLFDEAHFQIGTLVNAYLLRHPDKSTRLHKSLINRLLEPMQWHTVIISATAWQNFFNQRCHPAAQPEMRVAAEAIRDAMAASTPVLLHPGEYHMPYIRDDERDRDPAVLRQVSAARCARVSYLTHDGVRDIAEDLKLYERLTRADPMHASPLEHVATPALWNEHCVDIAMPGENDKVLELHLPKVGNFIGWQQLRLEVEWARTMWSFT